MSQPEGKLPNFFLVGAPKAGTTSLYHYLDQHPNIYMSPLKETSYFSTEIRPDNFIPALQRQVAADMRSMRTYLDEARLTKRFGGIVTDWSDYCKLFAGAQEERAIGEASVGYLWSKTAAHGIAARFPSAKILMVLRNPVDRAFSQYLHNVSDGVVRTNFADHVGAAMAYRNEQFGVFHPFLEVGLYAEQVRRFQACFPGSQIGVWLYEETRSPEFLRQVLQFLNVESEFQPSADKRYLEPQIPRLPWISGQMRRKKIWKLLRSAVPTPIRECIRKAAYERSQSMQMDSKERKILKEYYRQDVQNLQDVLQRDLSAWMD